MPTAAITKRGMGSVGSNVTGTITSSSPPPAFLPEASPTLSEREQLKIEFYKTYDVMTGVRIAATLGGFFSLMVLLVVYKSRCKSSKQLEDPRLTAAAAAAVAEAEAEERALSAALEAIARLPPRPGRGPRRSLCVELNQSRSPIAAPRFASVGGGYNALLAAPRRQNRQPRQSPTPLIGQQVASGIEASHVCSESRRYSSVTCSSTASSYLERRGSVVAMPCLPPPTQFPRHAAYDEPWDLYYPIDIQVIQATPDLSPCGSEAVLYGDGLPAAMGAAMGTGMQAGVGAVVGVLNGTSGPGRAPLASMGSVDPPEPDSKSLGSDSVFLKNEDGHVTEEDEHENEDEEDGYGNDDEEDRKQCGKRKCSVMAVDTEDEVSGFSTDSEAAGPSCRRFLRVPQKRKRPMERWDGCAGCVPRRRAGTSSRPSCQACMTISARVEAPRSQATSTTTSSSQSSLGTPPCSPPIELRHRPPTPLSSTPPVWSQETLF